MTKEYTSDTVTLHRRDGSEIGTDKSVNEIAESNCSHLVAVDLAYDLVGADFTVGKTDADFTVGKTDNDALPYFVASDSMHNHQNESRKHGNEEHD